MINSKYNLDVMTLLHENDQHFNLVIDKKSDLAVLGSLSFRFNVGPILDTMNDVASETEMNKEEVQTRKRVRIT